MNEINKSQQESDLLQLVGFRLDKEEFAIDILNVNEILKMMEVTEIPNTNNYIKGIVNIRERIIPIVDTREILNLPQKDNNDNTRIIVVEIKEKTVGFIVDEVTEVLRIPKRKTEPPPELVTTNIKSTYITSVARLKDRLLIMLDLQKLLLSEKELDKLQIVN